MQYLQARTNTFEQRAPELAYNESAASGTYQCSAANRGRLHMLVADGAVFVLAGTSASVSVTSSTGVLIPANTPFHFHVAEDQESLGWVASSGTPRVTIGFVSK